MTDEEKLKWLEEEIEFCKNRIKETQGYEIRLGMAYRERDILCDEMNSEK